MEFLSGGLFALFPIVVIGGVLALIFSRRASSGEQAPGIGTTRRLFLYGLSFVAMMVGAIGATLLVTELLELAADGEAISSDPTAIAFGIASSTVALGAWGLLTWAARRSLVRYPAEAGTLGRKLYVYGVLGVSAGVVAIFFTTFTALALQWDAGPKEIGPMLVWGLVWGWHWVREQREGQPSAIAQSVRRLYLYGTSVYGLIMLAVGAGILLSWFFGAAYVTARNDVVVHQTIGLWNAVTLSAFALALGGGLWWWFHWHYAARRDQRSELRRIVVYVVGILGGSVSLVVAVSIVIFLVLQWLIEPRSERSAFDHFETIPSALAFALAAAGVWAYHSSVAFAEASAAPGGARSALRVYRHGSALVGLGALWAGLIILIGVAIGLVTQQDGLSLAERGRGVLLVSALTLIIVGAPLWAWHWQRMQALVGAEDEERGTLARRAYVFGVLGVSVLVVVIALSTALFNVLDDLLSSRFDLETLHDARWAIAAAVVSAAVGAYHWQIAREERTLTPEEEPSPATERKPKQMTAAAPAGAEGIVYAIAERIGAGVSVWRRQDDALAPQLTAQQLDEIAERAQAAPGDRVLLILDANGVQVIPV